MIAKFGIPNWMFEPYVDTKENLDYRKQILKEGLFRLHQNTIEVDKSAVVEYYGESVCKPIAKMIVRSLAEYGLDTPRNRIEFAMRFVQDIPYGVPAYEDEARHFGGVSPPPKLLIEGFGDCDSKVLLFAGIMVYLIPSHDFIFLNQSKHVLSAIKAAMEPGLTFIRFDEETYLIAETAGPGKRLLGQEGNYYEKKFTPEKLLVSPKEIIPLSDPSQKIASVQPTREKVNEQAILIQNNTNNKIRFQISHDRTKWKNFDLSANQTGQLEVAPGSLLYFRIKQGANYSIYKIEAGMHYTVGWNSLKQSWELQQL